MNTIHINNPFSEAPVYYREVSGSTMDDSKSASSSGIQHGTVFLTGFQENGRGRIKGRNWYSEKGLNLTFTLVLKREKLKQELNFMPLIAGVALTSSIGNLIGKQFQLKWPNDLLFDQKKCAGILCEADSEYFYCGIGVNCNQKIFPDEILKTSTSLSLVSGMNIDLDQLLVLILRKFLYYLEAGDLWRTHFDLYLYKKNENIEIFQGQAESKDRISGINIGIGEDGQLLVEQSDGKVAEIYAGEIEL